MVFFGGKNHHVFSILPQSPTVWHYNGCKLLLPHTLLQTITQTTLVRIITTISQKTQQKRRTFSHTVNAVLTFVPSTKGETTTNFYVVAAWHTNYSFKSLRIEFKHVNRNGRSNFSKKLFNSFHNVLLEERRRYFFRILKNANRLRLRKR